MPSPILARADALMQRRRQSESGPLDDVPVLTDTVEQDESAPLSIGRQEDGLTVEHLVETLAARIKQRLATELPIIIEATVRDFLAEHGDPPPRSEGN